MLWLLGIAVLALLLMTAEKNEAEKIRYEDASELQGVKFYPTEIAGVQPTRTVTTMPIVPQVQLVISAEAQRVIDSRPDKEKYLQNIRNMFSAKEKVYLVTASERDAVEEDWRAWWQGYYYSYAYGSDLAARQRWEAEREKKETIMLYAPERIRNIKYGDSYTVGAW